MNSLNSLNPGFSLLYKNNWVLGFSLFQLLSLCYSQSICLLVLCSLALVSPIITQILTWKYSSYHTVIPPEWKFPTKSNSMHEFPKLTMRGELHSSYPLLILCHPKLLRQSYKHVVFKICMFSPCVSIKVNIQLKILMPRMAKR